MSTDRTFISNEAGQSLHERFRVLLGNNTRHFDCLIGYFFTRGFHKSHLALYGLTPEEIKLVEGLK